MIDLDAIKKRAEAASPGPWRDRERKVSRLVATAGGPYDLVLIAQDVYGPDGPFIAHAREDVPALIAEVERLRARLERLDLDAEEAVDRD